MKKLTLAIMAAMIIFTKPCSTNASIKGQNAVGKTTIFDAFTWLLFNKNSAGEEKFNVRPLDKDGHRIDNVEIKVVGVIYVDGKEVELSKVQKQNWVKKRGTNTVSLQGNPNSYEIDGYPKSEAEFKAYISGLAQSEEMFKMLTNPQYFSSLKWKDQRDILTMPGRLLSFHCMDLPLMKERDGVIGLKDFPALCRQIFEDCGFIYHSKVTIWKNPVTEMQRTKALGLLHKQIRKDSTMNRQGIPDYIVTMRKPGENPERVSHTHETFPVDVWQNYAKLPKLGLVKTRDKQIPQGRILNATISQEPNGHYYCSLCCTDIEFEKLPKTNQNIGLDLGLVDFAILSDGTKIDNPQFFEKSEKKLAKLQRELSRKKIGSNRWNKARIKVANLQKHISNQRNDICYILHAVFS